ncbi:MAG: type II secretion system F family protein [Candidatus Omnitrophica bacterium]|nr:type II secretion system F family protein [Candidatus Omnitrophota bacterium]
MIIEIITLILVFACVFTLTVVLFPQHTEKVIRDRLGDISGVFQKRKGPLSRFLSFFAPVNRLMRWKKVRLAIERSLLSAGLGIDVDEYLALKELSIVFALVACVLFFGITVEPLYLPVAVVVGYFLPNLWVKRKIEARHKAIVKTLPDVVDLLNLAVGAGLDFMMALDKVVQRAQSSPFIEELSQVYQEVKVGKSRADALRAMAYRIHLPDISSFVRTLINAERMGTPIGDVLRVQSEETRRWRFQRAERQALKAPIKLLLPLVFFILPVVMIIVGGPIILQFIAQGIPF